jgi:ATP-dependent DNA helicase UvrD/PcrA
MPPMLDDLTPPQRDAVTHGGGPLLVLAGAGAGKTRVLCRRLAWLVDRGARPDEVLALTFTAKAAEELRGRAEEALGRSHETLRVMTFHAHAAELARTQGAERGLLPPRTAATEDVRALMVLERLDQLDLVEHDLRSGPATVVDDLLRRIDRCKDELVGAGEFLAWAEEALRSAGNAGIAARRRRDLEFARVYAAHDRWLAEAGLEDFGESIVRALRLLRGHPDRLAAAREGARHVLVDEFQDTNHAQAQLLHLLAGGSESLVVVGDDDQGIYRFRGASVKNLEDFRARYPGAPEVRLEVNHRSTQAILDCADALVAPIPGRAEKRLVALPGASGPPPAFWVAPDEEGQARAVAAEVRRLAAAGVPYEEQAVLMRAVRLEAPPLLAALEAAGVPYQVHGGLGLFERREVRSALAWLRALTDPRDAQAHLRVAADPALGLPWARAAEAVAEAAAASGVVSGALLAVGEEADAPRLAEIVEGLGPALAALPAEVAVREVLDRSGLRRAALALGGAEGAVRLAALAAFERLGAEIARREPALDAAGLARRLGALAEVGFRGDPGSAAERIGVQVMTIHQAKGLEFDAVHVVGLVASSFPGKDRPGPEIPDALLPEALPRGRDAHLAEARRLAYVATTRARRHLVMATYRVRERGAQQRPSPFWEEARAAAGDPAPLEVGAPPERSVLAALGERRARWETAAARAAEARAEGAPGADDLEREALDAARALLAARADALRPPAPEPPPRPQPRPARPGLVLSPTDVERYRTCPLQYRFARVDRVPQRPSAARAIGIAAHAALEAHHRPGGPGGDGAGLVARFGAGLARLGVADTAEGRQAMDRAREWLPRYHERTVARGTRPVAVERAFTLRLGPHRLHGRVDRVDRRRDGGHQLVDYKTGRPPADAGRGAEDLVLTIYLAGARDAWGVDPEGATLEYVLDGDMRQVQPDPAEAADALEEVRRIAEGIGAGRFAPRPGWACRSCDYALLCPAQDR